jgi:hypothetical protein
MDFADRLANIDQLRASQARAARDAPQLLAAAAKDIDRLLRQALDYLTTRNIRGCELFRDVHIVGEDVYEHQVGTFRKRTVVERRPRYRDEVGTCWPLGKGYLALTDGAELIKLAGHCWWGDKQVYAATEKGIRCRPVQLSSSPEKIVALKTRLTEPWGCLFDEQLPCCDAYGVDPDGRVAIVSYHSATSGRDGNPEKWDWQRLEDVLLDRVHRIATEWSR